MPELPEIMIYLDALERRILNRRLEKVRLRSASLLRTFDPPLSAVERRTVVGLRRLGKRIVWEMEDGLFLVFHLMITGRFHWKKRGAAIKAKNVHAAFDFPDGTLLLTETGTKKRASLHLVRGEDALAAQATSPFAVPGSGTWRRWPLSGARSRRRASSPRSSTRTPWRASSPRPRG